MENKEFKSLLDYNSAMAQAKVMLTKGIITSKEYSVIETKMCEIFGINFMSLYRENSWINTPFRGNMSPERMVV